MVSHVLSDEHATGNGNVIRKDSESASLRETALKFETSRTQRRQPQITVFVTDRAVEFVAEIVRPNAVVQSTRSFIGSRTGPDNGRSEERRVGKECVSTCRSRWSPYNQKQKCYQ